MSNTYARWVAPLAAAAGILALSGVPAAAADNYKPPVAAGQQIVKYPEASQRNGEEGTVFIQVYVSDSGQVRKARLTRSSGSDRLDNAAIESVLAWRFKPATDAGRNVSGWANVHVTYKVPNNTSSRLHPRGGFTWARRAAISGAQVESMRAETERAINDIQQSLELLRRHL
jgi:TonB family protein